MKLIIKPDSQRRFLDFAEIIRFRELIYIFAWRDISVKYKQSIIGIGWVILQPLATMIIFSYFFGKISKIPSQGMAYPVFVLCGLVLWGLFSAIVTHSSNSMVDNENIIKKVYFPKLVIPLSSIVSTTPDFIINLLTLIVISVYFGTSFTMQSPLYLLLSILLTVSFAVGLGLILSSANVRFRDVRYALPFVLQMLMFTSPIIFPINILSAQNQIIMAVNPLATAIDLLRHSFIHESPNMLNIFISLISSSVFLVTGLYVFHKTERLFADLV